MAGKKSSQTSACDSLLVELLTEELPPKSLRMLGDVFAEQLVAEIVRHRLRDRNPRKEIYATPRRLAVRISEVLATASESAHSIDGPASSNIKAVEGFARKHNLRPESLERRQTEKGEIVVANFTMPGVHLNAVLVNIIEGVLKKLPIPKLMRWGEGTAQFARPVHGLVMLHGTRVIPGDVLGVSSSRKTLGHRFLSSGAITIQHADDYAQVLRGKGKVIADITERRAEIARQLEKAAGSAKLVVNDALLDEITALVEAPATYAGEFSAEFLAVPEECLILSMQQHQRYVPLRDRTTSKLLPRFLFVSNIEAKDPREIIHGNERVLRARLSDAKFFYDQDRKTRLEARVPRLANVVYHNKLGSQLERIERIQKIAAFAAGKLGTDVEKARRAAYLCKADLLTEMVGEFPELQGIMGGYYARADGEPDEITNAIHDLYRRRIDVDESRANYISDALCLAERTETLIGIWGIGLTPTGEKDPFGLRRAALDLIRVFHVLGILSKLEGKAFDLKLADLLAAAESFFKPGLLTKDVVSAITAFIYERYRNYLFTTFDTNVVDAVVSLAPPLDEVEPRVVAVVGFKKLPEAAALAAANKRAGNILRKEGFSDVRTANPELLIEDAEKKLALAIGEIRGKVDAHFARKQFVECLKTLAGVRTQVDAFFDKVLVNADDPKVRENRLALLSELNYLFNRVADISKLAA